MDEIRIKVDVETEHIKVGVEQRDSVKSIETEEIVVVDPVLQEKTVQITENGSHTIAPDKGNNGLSEVDVVVDVKPILQDKTVEIAENGTTEIMVDEGYDGLGTVEVVTKTEDLIEKLMKNELESYSNENVISIDNYAFYSKESLKNISFPNATSIGNHAFYNCEGLTSISFPKVTTLGNTSFNGCKNLISVDLPMASTFGNYDFQYCTGLTSIRLPNATKFGNNTFYGCTGLISVDIPNATGIGTYTFKGCTSLTDVNIPNLGTINAYTFEGTSSLTDFEAHKATLVNTYAFRNSGITNFHGDYIKNFGNYAFQSCVNLKVVDVGLKATITSGSSAYIAANAMNGCENLTALIIRSTKAWSLQNVSALTGTPIANGTGYIYVPDNLVDTYKAASNWAAYADQIKPISELPTE